MKKWKECKSNVGGNKWLVVGGGDEKELELKALEDKAKEYMMRLVRNQRWMRIRYDGIRYCVGYK
jgi:hypothetical protein